MNFPPPPINNPQVVEEPAHEEPIHDERTMVCSECGVEKPIDNFSRKVGTHSENRKKFCVSCENRIKYARMLYGLTPREMDAILSRPCYTCGHPSKYIHVFKVKGGVSPAAPLCKICHNVLKSLLLDDNAEEISLAIHNYLTIYFHFPFWLKMSIAMQPEHTYTDSPLIDYIESKDELAK
jgi:hypothetical protein